MLSCVREDDPVLSAVSVPFWTGVNEYQTVRGKKLQNCSSPGSMVESVVSTTLLKGSNEMMVAFAKASFAGGAARTGTALTDPSNSRDSAVVRSSLTGLRILLKPRLS